MPEVGMDENNAIDVVEHLIQRCRDGQNGFREAAEKVKRTDLKTFFNQVSEERGRFAQELQVELAKLGKPDKQVSGSTEGALHRAWVDTKVALRGDDHTVLDWLEHGEDVAKDAYNKALSGNLPSTLGQIVQRQAASVQRVHDQVKALRDQSKAA
jgi:uncharacterized protein (TIGR02284 family)